MKHLEYKGYTGTIEYSKEDELLFGKVMGIRGLLLYEGASGTELESDFKGVIDDYLEDCKAADMQPEKPFKGSFNVRIPSDLHRAAALEAMKSNTSLNSFVSESIRRKLIMLTSRTKASQARVAPKQSTKAKTSRKGKKVVKKSHTHTASVLLIKKGQRYCADLCCSRFFMLVLSAYFGSYLIDLR